MRKAVPLLVLLAVVAGLSVSDARASCCCSTPVYHAFDSYFACTDATPVAAFSWQVTNPILVSSDSKDIAREQVFGPGTTQILFDWSDEGFLGCPAFPPKRIAIVVQANDGKGLIVSLSGSSTDYGYLVEVAHKVDTATGGIAPLPCGDGAGAPRILSQTSSGGMVSLALHFDVPRIDSDCDPDSVGVMLVGGTCPDNFAPLMALGRIVTRTGACTTGPVLQLAQWTDTGAAPDASGNATVTLAAPPADQCLYVGNTATIDGIESGGIIGFVVVRGTACVDADGDGVTTCLGDCNDGRADVHPGADEVCDGVDNDCDGQVDEDANGVDTDRDLVPNACDNCPTIPNASQDPEVCDQRIDQVSITFSSLPSHGSGVVTWVTTHEVDIQAFNIVVFDSQDNRIQQNTAPIRCEECITGGSHIYSFVIPKHKSGRNVFVELIRMNGTISLWGPATRN